MLVRPDWDEQSRRLALSFPDGTEVAGIVELGPEIELSLYGDPFPTQPVLGPWDDALSELAREQLRLLWAPFGAVDRGLQGGSASLISRASLARLGEVSGAGAPLDGRRFRMLLEIDGVEAHEEDGWIGREVRAGTASILVNGDVGRCVVTSHDPDTGVTDVDTLGALAAYRRTGVTEPLPLGVYGEVVRPGRVRIGDEVVPTSDD